MRTLFCIICLVVASLDVARAQERIESAAVIDAPSSEVWKAWTTSEGLQSWLAPHADIDLRIGGLMRTNYDPSGTLGDAKTIENRVLVFEPGKMLAIQVSKAPADFPFRDKVTSMWTVLYFEALGENQVRLRVVGLGFEADDVSQKMKEFFKSGNAYTLAQLKKKYGVPSKSDPKP